MSPYHEDEQATIYCGDCREVLQTLPDDSVDAVVTDPPYGLAFMGKRWDYDVPSVEVWAECLRVLKPGGHLLAFAGTRTQHRMAVRIEDAGFEIRDMIAWVYGSGFPKSLDVSKAIDKMDASESAKQWQGWGTALKPALEPITVARKPLIGTVAANVLEYGTGAINVDGCRVGMEGGTTRSEQAAYADSGWRTGHTVVELNAGRWPANLIHDGSEEVVGLFPETAPARRADRGKGIDGATFQHVTGSEAGVRGHDDSGGSAARFFYEAKADRSDRGHGNNHPTVKPQALMRYLVRLVCPPGGVVLDPFGGSGTTAAAARLEQCRSILCELSAEYCEIAVERLRQRVLF